MYGYRRRQGRLYRYEYRYAEGFHYEKLSGCYAGLYVNLGKIRLCKTLGKPGKILWGICTTLPLPCPNHFYRPIHAPSSHLNHLSYPIHAPSSHLNHLSYPIHAPSSHTTSLHRPCPLHPSLL